MEASDREQHDRFLRLFMGLEESLRLFVRSLLLSREEEREVMQETAVVLWRKFDPALEPEAFRRWAFGVARMEVLAFRRDRARDRHAFGDEVLELLSQTVLDQADSLDAERQALHDCLEKLPEPQRQLITAAYAPQVRIDQLAEQLGRTAMAVYKSLHRIRIQLMDCTQRVLAGENSP
ncbi:sigma-70 family RNA polymerase sigma factor [Lignipirellula cremea]|uniref:RNA polymerase sigma factor n=1 Tax=Lignipirellula cremea TaxID=2528010 RepID=A0A518DZ71_9BACT|nr:sigma-70 family RNA polymerase sigma factor [Lignipirellula cremea]QDU97139.1 RNA polymerase sigma factor [Lignipirellula cremea]